MTVAAMVARGSSSDTFVGRDAPSLRDVSADVTLRRGSRLAHYGARRNELANKMLDAAISKVHESRAIAVPDLRNIVSLSIVETLILLYRQPQAFSLEAAREARPYSAAAASLVKILAEDEVSSYTAERIDNDVHMVQSEQRAKSWPYAT